MSAPSYSLKSSIFAATRITNNAGAGPNRITGTVDLTAAAGAWISLEAGRLGATAPASAIPFRVTQMPAGSGSPFLATAGDLEPTIRAFQSSTTAGNASTVATTDRAAGDYLLTLASGTGFAVGDIICIYDTTFTRLEFNEVVRVNGAVLSLLKPLQYAHTAAQADNVTRIAEAFGRFWVPGGCHTRILADYSASATGSDYVVRATADILTAAG